MMEVYAKRTIGQDILGPLSPEVRAKLVVQRMVFCDGGYPLRNFRPSDVEKLIAVAICEAVAEATQNSPTSEAVMEYPGDINALSPHYRSWWNSTPPEKRPELLAKWDRQDRIRKAVAAMTPEELNGDIEVVRANLRKSLGE